MTVVKSNLNLVRSALILKLVKNNLRPQPGRARPELAEPIIGFPTRLTVIQVALHDTIDAARFSPRPQGRVTIVIELHFLLNSKDKHKMFKAMTASGVRTMFVLLSVLGTANPHGLAQQPNSREQMVAKAIEFLKVRGQNADGAISPKVGIGVTALGASALIQNGVSIADPAVAKALKLVEEAAKRDGGIYAEGSRLMMYETSVAMLCLQQANKGGSYDTILKKAAGFLKGQQFDEEDSIEPSDLQYGGAGYGGKSRPDLSNTAFFIDALKSLGDPEHDEAIAKALTFVSRCQNLESQYNTSEDAAKINDGGFYYTVVQEGVSAAGESPDGGLRSYGSMTYSGFKSMLYAGLDKDDPRVKAAMDWIQKNYTVKENPGLGDAGLYYYYQLFAKALDAAGIDKLVDDEGIAHDWRAELVTHLASLQAEDGSWTNSNARWMEGDANLATTFCLLALSHCGE